MVGANKQCLDARQNEKYKNHRELPKELLCRIFSFLPSKKLVRLLCLNKSLHGHMYCSMIENLEPSHGLFRSICKYHRIDLIQIIEKLVENNSGVEAYSKRHTRRIIQMNRNDSHYEVVAHLLKGLTQWTAPMRRDLKFIEDMSLINNSKQTLKLLGQVEREEALRELGYF